MPVFASSSSASKKPDRLRKPVECGDEIESPYGTGSAERAGRLRVLNLPRPAAAFHAVAESVMSVKRQSDDSLAVISGSQRCFLSEKHVCDERDHEFHSALAAATKDDRLH